MTATALLRRRPWHVALAAFAAGLALAAAPLIGALAAAVAFGAALAASRAPRLAAGAGALVLAGAAAGGARLASLDRAADSVGDSRWVSVRAHLASPARDGPFGSSAEVDVSAVSAGPELRGARLLLRAPASSPLGGTPETGDELLIEGRLRPLTSAGPPTNADRPTAGGADRSRDPPFDYSAYLRRRGVAGELLADDVRATGRRRGGVAGVLDGMRRRAETAVAAGMGPGESALLRGMVLGEDEQVDAATRDDWRDAGLSHLLAVSGQNVMLLAALALPLLMLAGLQLRARFLAVAFLIALYVPLAGAGPSLQRAGIMGLAGIAAMAASRPASRAYALLLAAAGTLAWNPRIWGDPGWQLSFAAVAGILVLGTPLQRAFRKGLEELAPAAPAAPAESAAAAEPAAAGEPAARGSARGGRHRHALLLGLADGVAITVAATFATAPLLAHHFGSVSIAALPANLLALPAVAPAMWLGMLKIAVGQFGNSVVPAACASLLGVLASVPVSYLERLAERFADMPGGRIALPLGTPAAMLLSYAALGAAGRALHRGAERLDTWLAVRAIRWRGIRQSRRRAVAAVVIGGAVLMLAVVLARPGPPRRLTIRFLDVGQGDATLIQHPDGTAVLFDGGPPEAGVARLLRRAGVRRLALVVATHASRDHHGGLPEVLRRFPVGALLDGGDGTADPAFRALEREADRRGIERIPALAPLDLSLADGDLRIRVLSPPPRLRGPPPEDPNLRAVVAVVSCGGFDLLLSADAESEALLPLDLPDVDAMKVPHHGSADPGVAAELERLRPEVAAVEVGAGNSYGHPAPSTLAALQAAGVQTYRTDRDGTIALMPDGNAMHIETDP